MAFLVFADVNDFDKRPVTIERDGVKIDVSDYMYIRFEEFIRFEFSHEAAVPDGHFESFFAIIHSSTVTDMSINEYCVPIISIDQKNVVGTIRCKITKCASAISFACMPFVRKAQHPVWIGHRGSGADRLGALIRENTMESFNNATKQKGISGIELDVFLTNDEKLSVFHDMFHEANLNGCRLRLPVTTLRFREDMCHEHRCPLLEDVIRGLEPATAGIVIELKYPTNDVIKTVPDLGKYTRTHFVNRVLACLESNHLHLKERWIAVSSFDPDIVWLLHEALKDTNVLVIHNTWLGHEIEEDNETYGHFADPRSRCPEEIARRAVSLNLGLAFAADYSMSENFSAHFAQKNLLLFSYGSENMHLAHVRNQRHIDAFFLDDISLINQY